MRILVGVKRVIDYNVSISLKEDGTGVKKDNIQMSMNPFDEVAVEEAVRLKESGKAIEVIAISIGTETSEEVLRTAMAMGADRAILIKTNNDSDNIESLTVAKILRFISKKENIDLVILGKQAIDNDASQTGPMLSALLNWSQATFASKIDIYDNHAMISREIDNGHEVLEISLPTVITTSLKLNNPRFASLPNIMKARKKPLEIINATDTGIDLTQRLSLVAIREPEKRQDCIIVSNATELVNKLKNEAKII